MPQIDVAATRAAARGLAGTAAALPGEAAGAGVSGAAAELDGSVTQHVLHDLDGLVSLRLLDLGAELEAMAAGMTELADNTARATGER
ncbi:hypothetical protein [Ornithinimicrobium cerasi]|uniref:Excreted virulence factor EspC, type VII ESX diderm n=1 Tax=Ornithinimicrobium cerasi TaxID=2248773 RepID=A0A285VX30_9MICO|nr:hypothetical protein [Ornithinimicrobium cerasi]SOC58148.1 hypothetical protein SAMN05421879_12310 [Ornithinimicrobium cerasi]